MSQDYATVFINVIFNGPLFIFEFAQVTDVIGDFGYNTNLKLPNAAAVPSFPFFKSVGSASPQFELDDFFDRGWFFLQVESFWIAVDMTVEAFELLIIQTVIVIQWDSFLKLGLYGLATADIPCAIDGSGTTFAYVQLGLAATVDFAAGTMKIDD